MALTSEEPLVPEFPWVPANEAPLDGVVTKDLVVEVACGVWLHRVWLRLFLPVEAQETASDSTFPVVVFFHGGGFVTGGPDTVLLCRTMVKDCQVIVVSGEYRKAPQFKYPVAYEDGLKMVKWLQAHYQKCLPPAAGVSRCFIMGDSAGANIAHHVGVTPAEAAQDLMPVSFVGPHRVAAFFWRRGRISAELTIFSEVVGTVDKCDKMWKSYLPVDRLQDLWTRLQGPDRHWPPSLVVMAEADVCWKRGIKHSEDLKRFGKEVQMEVFEGAEHVFHCMGGPLVHSLFATIKSLFVGAMRAMAFGSDLWQLETDFYI